MSGIITTRRARPVLNVSTRWAIRRDRASIVDIDRATAAHGGRPAWGLKRYEESFAQRNVTGMVAVQRDRPGVTELDDLDKPAIGVMVYRLYSDHIYLLDFAVHPDHRRRLVGWQMMTRLTAKLGPRRRRLEWLVRESCLDAQLFARATGWRATNVVREAFERGGGHEDGYRFVFEARPGELDTEDHP